MSTINEQLNMLYFKTINFSYRMQSIKYFVTGCVLCQDGPFCWPSDAIVVAVGAIIPIHS